MHPFDLLIKDLPKSYVKLHWRSLLAVAKKLSVIRKYKIVDIFMDRETRRTIVDGFIADNRKMFNAIPAPALKPCDGGFDFVAITVGGVEMRLVWHGWLDSMRIASLERGLQRRAMAMVLDFRDCWTDSGVPIFKKLNHHRIILFK